jgi:long-chain acyl-CoA synthetase
LSPPQSGEAQARLGIYGINRSEWTKLLMAAFSQRICVAPLYDSLGANACAFIIGHAELTTVACERSKLDNMLKSKASLPKFVNVVLFEDPTPEEIGKAKAAGLSLRGVSDLAKAGKSAAQAESPDSVPTGFPKPEDWGYIMYTSGTTGDPKGVLLSHQNILSSSGGLLRQNPHLDLLRPDDVYLSFLPLAHSFETCMQVCCILVGCGVGFYQGDARKLVSEDMPDLRPTIMAAVPRIYARIYDKVMAGVEAKGWLAKTLFSWGMSARSSRWFYEEVLFKKLRSVVGGRIRLMASGAAPLSENLHRFLTQVFGCPVLQGYGMTENCAAAVVQPLGYRLGGNVGGFSTY